MAKLQRLAAGTYTVRWTAVSSDDKNVAKGSFRFVVASAAGTPMVTAMLPVLKIISPASGVTVDSPVVVVFETPADLSKMTMSAQMSGSMARHLHLDLDGRMNMPTVTQLTRVGASRYQYDLGRLAPGGHTLRSYWADANHKPAGSVQSVTFTVK
jgi:hypothetical protein